MNSCPAGNSAAGIPDYPEAESSSRERAMTTQSRTRGFALLIKAPSVVSRFKPKEGEVITILDKDCKEGYTNKFKSVAKAVAGIHADTAVLDGEVVATDAKGQPSFQVLQNRGKLPPGYQLIYYVFDTLFLDG